MAKNADGRWEITMEMKRAKEFYKFYNPAMSGDIAYIEDPEPDEEVANPFGSKNAVLRRPKAGAVAGASAGTAEEEYPKLSFGMWSRNYYLMRFGSQLSQKVSYDKNGDIASGDDNTTDKMPLTGYAVRDKDLTKRWQGEYGTTKDNATRVWLQSHKLRSSSTWKVHGLALKHLQLDAEVNCNYSLNVSYNSYWSTKGNDNSRYEALELINRGAGSGIMNLFLGPIAKNGAWGRWVGEKTGEWGTNDNGIWIDQIVISFPFDDFEVKLGVLGNNAYRSKDPMKLLSGKRTGDKEDIATNVELIVHPTKIKGLNLAIGGAHSWRDDTGGEGDFKDTVNANSRKFMTYFDASYTLSVVEFGYMNYFTSWSPMAIDMFANGDMTQGLWARIKPVKGLIIELQGANQLSTVYLDSTAVNDVNNYVLYRTKKTGFDFLANSAILASVSYVMPGFFDVAYTLAAGGTMFKGNLGAEDGRFSGWDDSDRRVVGTKNYSSKLVPYYYNNRGSQISNKIDLSIAPLKNDLIKIGYTHDLVIGKLDNVIGLAKEDKYDYYDNGIGLQTNKIQIDNLFNPSISSKVNKDLSLVAATQFSLTMYQDELQRIDGKDKSYKMATAFTFNKAKVGLKVSNISKILKSVNLDYTLEFQYYPGYYENGTTKTWEIMGNSIQWKNFYNQIVGTMYFDKDISLGLGFIVRNFRGDQRDGNVQNQFNPELMKKLVDAGQRTTADLENFYTAIVYYWNIGGALQFKWKLPFDDIANPTFFANIGLGWDPFAEDNDTTMDFREDKTSPMWTRGLTNNWKSEASIVAFGLQWAF